MTIRAGITNIASLVATATVAALAWSVPAAQAHIIGTSGGIFFQGGEPPTLDINAISTNDTVPGYNAFAYDEGQNVALTAPLTLDAHGEGAYSVPSDLNGGTVPAGTIVDSHLVHADDTPNIPIGTNIITDGVMTFDTPVLGVVASDANLVASDFLGNSATTFASADREADIAKPGARHVQHRWQHGHRAFPDARGS
jgi:hypothetical protein